MLGPEELQERSPLVFLRGVIIPADWDAAGNVVAAALSARDEAEYRIEKSEMGNALLDLIHKEVEVQGEVSEAERGKSIKVVTFKLKKTNDPQTRKKRKQKRGLKAK
jgi:hypothetical protein